MKNPIGFGRKSEENVSGLNISNSYFVVWFIIKEYKKGK